VRLEHADDARALLEIARHDGEAICESHERLGMGNVYRGSRVGRAEQAASSAAFGLSATRLASALDDLAELALSLEARRLVAKFAPAIDTFDAPEGGAVVAMAVSRLARCSGDAALVSELRDQARRKSADVALIDQHMT